MAASARGAGSKRRWVATSPASASDAPRVPPVPSTASGTQGPQPIKLDMSVETFSNLENDESTKHIQGHGLYRFLELYSEKHAYRRAILSLPVIAHLGKDAQHTELVKHLLDDNLPVTALLPFEAMLQVCLGELEDRMPSGTRFLGQVLTTMLLAMYGFNDLQLHWIWHTFIERAPDSFALDTADQTPMAWAAKHFKLPDSVKTDSTVDEFGASIKKFDVCNAPLVFQHCAKINDGWTPPPYLDFSAQGMPAQWGNNFIGGFRTDCYDYFCKLDTDPNLHGKNSMASDFAENIFKDSTIPMMLGHMAVRLRQQGANFRCLWQLYAFFSVRPSRYGVTLRDMQKISREYAAFMPSPKLDPIKSLGIALEQLAKTYLPKGGQSSLSSVNVAQQAWKSGSLTPIYGVATWPSVGDITRARYLSPDHGVHPLFFDLVDGRHPLTIFDQLGLHSLRIEQPRYVDGDWYQSDPILMGDLDHAAEKFQTFEMNQAKNPRHEDIKSMGDLNRLHTCLQWICIPIGETSTEDSLPRVCRAKWNEATEQSESGEIKYPYLLNGTKMPAITSLLFHGRIKSSDHKTPARGESASADGSAVVYGFSKPYCSLYHTYSAWTYFGNGLYFQSYVELHPKNAKDIKSIPRDNQMAITEEHKIAWLMISIIHVNSLRAYRPASFSVNFPRPTGYAAKLRQSWWTDGQGIRFPEELEASPVDFTLIYNELWDSMKKKMGGTMQFAAEAFNKLTCGVFKAKPASTGGDDAPQDPTPAEAQAEQQQRWKRSKSEHVHKERSDGKVYVTGTNAGKIDDPRPNPRLRYCVGNAVDGDWGNHEDWDFIVGEQVDQIKQSGPTRRCDLQLDRASRTKLVDFMKALKAEPSKPQEFITREARENYALWCESCDKILPFLSKIQPYTYPETTIAGLRERFSSPRVMVACMLNSGNISKAGQLARAILVGWKPPSWDFVCKGDNSLIADSSFDMQFSAKEAKEDEKFIQTYPNNKPKNKKANFLSFETALNHVLRGSWPNDFEQTVSDYNEIIQGDHWQGLLTDNSEAKAQRESGQPRMNDRTYGLYYRSEYYEKWGKDGEQFGGFLNRSSQVVRCRIHSGADLPTFRILLKELQTQIIDDFRRGKEMRCNRNLIICYSLNDIVRGKSGKYVINKSHWDTDIKLFLDALLLAAQKTYGDNVAVITGLDSEFFYTEQVEDYDFIQKKVLDHLRQHQIFTVNLAEHWHGLTFRDQLHLENSVTNVYKNIEMVNAVFLIMSWMSHCPAKCFNEYEYGEDVIMDEDKGTIKFPDPNNVKVDLPDEVPFSNIPINDEAMERFLGTRLYNTVREGTLSSLRTVAPEGREEDPLAELDDTTDDILAQMEASKAESSKPDSTGRTDAEETALLKEMSKDKPPAPMNKQGPFQPKDAVLAEAVRQTLADAKAKGGTAPEPASTGKGVPPKAMPEQPQRGRGMETRGSAKTDSTVGEPSALDEAKKLVPAINAISKKWNAWFDSFVVQDKLDMDNDMFQMEDILSDFLAINKSRGRGKRNRKHYQGQPYTLPYTGSLYLPTLGVDLGNIVFEDFFAVPGYKTARCNFDFVITLYLIAVCLHPDLIHFITWGRKWPQIIRNLASMNYLYQIFTQAREVEKRHHVNIKDPRFHEVLYQLFRHERGCQGTIVMPEKLDGKLNNPTSFDVANEGQAWTTGPPTKLAQGIYGEYREVDVRQREMYLILDRFSKFDQDFKSYFFQSSESKCGRIPSDVNNEVGKVVAMRRHGTSVFIDDCPHQAGYLDFQRRESSTSHIVMPIHSQRRVDDRCEYTYSQAGRNFMGRHAKDPVSCLKIYTEFAMYVIGHNFRHGHYKHGPASMFPPDWDKRPLLKTGKEYPKAFNIDADRGINYSAIGVPDPTKEDGDIASFWFNEDSMLRRILRPTKEYLSIADELCRLHRNRRQEKIEKGKEMLLKTGDALVQSMGGNLPGALQTWIKEAGKVLNTEPESTGSRKAADSSETKDMEVDETNEDEEEFPEFAVGDSDAVRVRSEKSLKEDDYFSDYCFCEKKITFNNNGDGEMDVKAFLTDAKIFPDSRQVFERQANGYDHPTRPLATQEALISYWATYNRDNPNSSIGGISEENCPPVFEEDYFTTSKVMVFDPKLSAPSERKLYLFAPCDMRARRRHRFGAVVCDIPTDFVLGDIVTIMYSMNFVSALVNAPRLKDIIDAGLYVYEPFLTAYAKGYIRFLWAIIWSSHDETGRPLGRPRAAIGDRGEIANFLNQQGHLVSRGAMIPDMDGLAVTRKGPMKKEIAGVSIVRGEGPQPDPYTIYLDNSAKFKKEDPDSPITNPWIDDDEDDAEKKKSNKDEKDDADEWPEDAGGSDDSDAIFSKSPLVTAGIPEKVNLAMALEFCKDEHARFHKHKDSKHLPFPELATDIFRYRVTITCPKCPYYYNEYSSTGDFAQQIWYNTVGDEIRSVENRNPKEPRVQFKDGPNSKLLKNESAWVLKLMPPRRHFQACRLDRELRVKDVDGSTYPITNPIINVWRSKLPLHENSKPGTASRYVDIEVFPGRALNEKLRESIQGALYRPLLSSGNPPTLEPDSTGLSEEEQQFIEEHLKDTFKARRSKRFANISQSTRTDLGTIPQEFLRGQQMIDHDERNRSEEWLSIIQSVTKRFVWHNLVNTVVLPTNLENERVTAIKTRSEEMACVVYNVTEIIEGLDVSRLRISIEDNREFHKLVPKVNPILQGDRPGIHLSDGCWLATDVFMEHLCSHLAAGNTPDAAEKNIASRNTIVSVHRVICALARDRSNAFEVRVELIEAPSQDDDEFLTLSEGTGNDVRYYMPVASGIDIAIGVTKPKPWDIPLEEFLHLTATLPNNEMPTKWDTLTEIQATNGLARDSSIPFSRKVRITHFRRAHGIKSDKNDGNSPYRYFQFARGLDPLKPMGRNRKLVVAEMSEKVPEYLYIVSRKESVRWIAELGCLLSEKSYPISGETPADPNNMIGPIVATVVSNFASKAKSRPAPEERVRNRDGVTIVIHARAAFLDGWKWVLNDRGAWTTNSPIASGYIVAILQNLPFFRILFWRPYVVTGFDYEAVQQYSKNDDQGRRVFHDRFSRADKKMPTDVCACCGRAQFYGSSFCAECQAPMFSPTWIASKFIPPPAMFQLSNRTDARVRIAQHLRQRCADDRNRRPWDGEHYAWHAAPMYELRFEPEDIDDEVFRSSVNEDLKMELRSLRSHDHYDYSWWLRQAIKLGHWNRFCTIGSVFAAAISRSLSRGFSLEVTNRLRTYLSAARDFIEKDFDPEILDPRDDKGQKLRGGGHTHKEKFTVSPTRRAHELDQKEIGSIKANVLRLAENPHLNANSPAFSKVGYALGQFTSVVDRIHRDSIFRVRLSRNWRDQAGRMDQDFIHFSVFHLYASELERQILLKTSLMSSEEADANIVVPHFDATTEPGALSFDTDQRDEEIVELRGQFQRIRDRVKTMAIPRKDLNAYLKKYELCVPTTEDEEKRRKYMFEKILDTQTIEPSSKGDGESEKDEETDADASKTVLECIHDYMIENSRCRCGYKHPLGSRAQYLTCEECFSACCNNQKCRYQPCRGSYELMALKMQAMSERAGKVEYASAPYGPEEHKRLFADGATASDASGKGAGKKSSSIKETGTPYHKQINPITHDFFDFADIANRRADEQATLVGSKGKGKSDSTDVQLPAVPEYSNEARTLRHNLNIGQVGEVGANKGKGAGKRPRAGQDEDENPAPNKKGKGKGKHNKTKPTVDWDARRAQREASASEPGKGPWTKVLFPSAYPDEPSSTASSSTTAPDKSTAFFKPSAVELSSEGSHSRLQEAEDTPERGRRDLTDIAERAEKHSMFRDVREPLIRNLASVKVDDNASQDQSTVPDAETSFAGSEMIDIETRHIVEPVDQADLELPPLEDIPEAPEQATSSSAHGGDLDLVEALDDHIDNSNAADDTLQWVNIMATVPDHVAPERATSSGAHEGDPMLIDTHDDHADGPDAMDVENNFELDSMD